MLCLRDYSFDKFLLDLLAGITVGLVALPLAMAFAIASGLTPQAGIYCAIVTAFVVSILGGSKTQIAGPTGAFVVVIAGIVAVHGVDGLSMCTVMAGVMLVVMGMTGMGSAVKYIPRPIVVGFTNGIAILIASTQVKDFFGWSWKRFRESSGYASSPWQVIFAVSISGDHSGIGHRSHHGWVSANFEPHSGPIVALVLGTAAVVVSKLRIETIGTRFGGIPSGLPHFVIPTFRADLILVAWSGRNRGDAGRHRVSHVRRGLGPHEQ